MAFIDPTDTKSPYWMLLRSGLWGDAAYLDGFPKLSDEQWAELLQRGKRTSTINILADGMELLDNDLRPALDTQRKLAFAKITNLNTHAKHNTTISKLFALLQEHGIDAVLLKGQQLAQNYRHPESRICGDIDVFIGEEQIDRLVGILKDLGYTCEEEINDTEKHVVLYFNDLAVELHRHALFLPQPGKNAKFQHWWNGQIFTNPDTYTIDGTGQWHKGAEAQGQKVAVPETTMNVFFTFTHIFKHYISEVQFRQFLDLARLLYVEKGAIDTALLEEKISQYGLMLPWQIIANYLHRYLGLPTDCIPFYQEVPGNKVAKFEKRINNRYFNPKYKTGKRPDGRIAGKLYSYFGYYSNATETFSLFPSYTIANLWDCTIRGVALLFNKDNRLSGTAEHYIERTRNTN